MSFLAPLYLALGLGAAVPLLLHLLRRRAGMRVEFPAARYLARAEQEHRRTLRLRNLLLMLVRVAAIVVVAMAASRPVGRWLGAGHGPTALAIVVDNSMSSGLVVDGAPVLDRLKTAADRAVASASAADRLWLVTADGLVRGGNAATLRDALSRLAPLPGAGDLRTAMLHAAGAVRSSGLDARQVAVLTDGQRSSWSTASRVGDAPILVWSPAIEPPPTHGVTAVETRPSRWTPRGIVAARIRSADSASYRVTLGGRTLSRGTAAPSDEIVVRAQPPERGWIAGTIELEPDELPADNVGHFAVWIGAPTGVRALSGAGPFAADALDVLRGAGRISAGNDVEVVSGDELSKLPALIVPPADPVRLGAANRALERLGVPWRFGDRRSDRAMVIGDGLRDVEVFARYELVSRSGAVADTIARAGGAPWIVAGPGYVIIGSPLREDATTLPVRAAFIPWIGSVLSERLTGEPGALIVAAPGARVHRPVWADAVERPDGRREAMTDSTAAPMEPGVHFLLRQGKRAGAVVVNAPPSESELAYLVPDDLAAALSDSSTSTATAATSADDWSSRAFRGAARKSLVQPLLLGLLGMLVMETLLVVTRRAPVPAAA